VSNSAVTSGAAQPEGSARDPLAAAAKPFAFAALLALAFMVLITTVAVFARWLFRQEVFGVVDMMELALAFCVFLALPGVFLRDEQVTVDLVDSLGSSRLTFVLRLFGYLLGIAFVGLTLSQMIGPALEKLHSAETTMTLQIPRYWHWLPLLVGFGASALAIAAVGVRAWRRGASFRPPAKTSLD
jgi:TRAP-type C4-dicarboxylate transport system permease small subunit